MKKQIERLESALLETGMMNERFIEMIKSGEVDREYVAAAFDNLDKARNLRFKVQQRYVLGVLLDEDEKHVLVILKNRPAWQLGKLNCVGGKIEGDELPIAAMTREFLEETNYQGEELPRWQYVGKRFREATYDFQPTSYEMFIFVAHVDTRACENMSTDEPTFRIPLNLEVLQRRGVPGLAWVVDIARCAKRENFHVRVQDPTNYNIKQ